MERLCREAAGARTQVGALFVPGWSPQFLRPRSPPLHLESPLAGRRAGLRRDAAARDGKRLAQLPDESLDRQLAVPQLTSFVLSHCTHYRPGTRYDAPLLNVGQSRGPLDVKQRLDPSGGLLRMLTTGPARP